ncbi:hypothetical protein BJ138DRAFT_1233443 [Hygrophoropsis aurantiaca]|uniref:Uncharacterized protein n=1 Tax=Hygrophoropsis aurantiaca TaxID=72124 RepID=A0ACB7ZV48_9AGAM|nr:hypothetical protein BJ138DRAFT_1233443 [Hygrophoropsis aurantiaca]
MSFRCSGCRSNFTRQGDLFQHFGKSTKNACIVACNHFENSIRKPVRRDMPRHPSSSESPTTASGHTAQQFEGDFFGQEYDDADFPFFDEDEQETSVEVDLGHGTDTVDGVDESDSDDEDGMGGDVRHEPETRSAGNRTPQRHDIDIEMGSDTPMARTGPAEHLDHLRKAPAHVTHFGGQAGVAITDESLSPSAYHAYSDNVNSSRANPWAPFSSRIDWELARWAKLRGLGSNAFTELLAIEGIHEALKLSYRNTDELNKIIDNELPTRRPTFTHQVAQVGDETFDLFSRDILECIRALYGDPEHAQYLSFAPERHYTDANKTECLYHEMHTGKWWWSTQEILEKTKPGATIVPVILSSDKTQITLFRNKTAYPVYLTIGNLPKSIRHKPSRQGHILLAYLPTTRLTHITNKAARRRTLANMFHACMTQILKPLEEAGVSGVIMTSGDGVKRRCHPLLASYVGDYPEQCLVTGAYNGDCPVCECGHDELGDFPCKHNYRELDLVFEALDKLGTNEFAQACREANIKPLQHPFWEILPYANIFQSITPDILHQLYQGVVKYLISWLTSIVGEAEIDARVTRLPPNHAMRIFRKGITTLSRLPGNISTAPLVCAMRALLDFLYLAQYPVHSDTSLAFLETSLRTFHENKHIFVTLGIRNGFKIPKLHFLEHYKRCITLLGTTDNYNTEATERLHIDFAKDAYTATNHKEEFWQMTKWLERREKVLYHANYVTWRIQQSTKSTISAREEVRWEPPDMACVWRQKMTIHPSRKGVDLNELISPISKVQIVLTGPEK